MSVSFGFPDSGAGLTGWRPLRLKDPYQRGWDVFDLQCRLSAVGAILIKDGVFGPRTQSEVKIYQSGKGLVVDGIAGSMTQVTLGRALCGRSELPARVLGQMQKESSFLCGIYTTKYTNGSRDCGPVQMNDRYHPDYTEAFDATRALPVLVKQIKEQYARYKGWGVAEDKAWRAAQGSWNSPAFADAYASGRSVPDTFIQYMDDVTIYA